MNKRFIKLMGILTLVFTVNFTCAQTKTQWGSDGFFKIENGSNGFNANVASGDRFSRDHDQAGDINGDGIIDIVVGARSDDDGATDAGAVYILFMNSDGTVQSNQKISMLEGDFSETLNAGNFFGYGVAGIGDYDNDGIPDIAVSAPAPPNRAIYIIHLNADGTVKNFVKNENITAQGLSAVGDLNNDGRIDLVACDPGSDIGGTNIGAIRILFFDAASQVISNQTKLINPLSGGFGTGLVAGDEFGGREVAMIGDIDNDGTKELAVAAFKSDGGKGAIWILSLDNNSFDVVSKLKITEGLNGFTDTLTVGVNPNGTLGAQFGHSLCKVGDLNGDGVPDLMTGANQQNEGWGYILYLNPDKTVKTYNRINNSDGGFGLALDPVDRFSRSISFIGDLRGDGTIAVNYGGGAAGAAGGTLYLLFLKPCDFTQVAGFNRWSGGNVLFSNWNHPSQSLSSDSLTFEQCASKAFETDAVYLTYNFNDGRCICMDSTAVLATSTELSTAFYNECFTDNNSSNITINVTGNLEGPYNIVQNLMNDDLRQKGYIPLVEPYSAATIFQHNGNEETTQAVLNQTGVNAIVDWVLVELRSKTNSSQVLASRAALIQRDGDVVDVDGISAVSFPLSADEYYVALRHRNHLGVMTIQSISLSSGTLVDFKNTTNTWGINAQKNLTGTTMGLWAGNSNSDSEIIFQGGNNDPNNVFFDVLLAPSNIGNITNYIHEGYYASDINLDGTVIYQGIDNEPNLIFFNVLTNSGNPSISTNYIIQEQLP